MKFQLLLNVSKRVAIATKKNKTQTLKKKQNNILQKIYPPKNLSSKNYPERNYP